MSAKLRKATEKYHQLCLQSFSSSTVILKILLFFLMSYRYSLILLHNSKASRILHKNLLLFIMTTCQSRLRIGYSFSSIYVCVCLCIYTCILHATTFQLLTICVWETNSRSRGEFAFVGQKECYQFSVKQETGYMQTKNLPKSNAF